MIHSVLDFEMEGNYSSPPSSGVHHRPKKPSLVGEEGIVELLWQNGQVVMQSQNHRPYSSLKKYPPPPPPPPKSSESAVIPAEASIPPQEESAASHLLMPEDDMASWLNYHLDSPSFDRDLCADFLYPTTPPAHSPGHHHRNPPPPPPPPKPPIPPGRRAELHGSGTSDPSRWRESTVVDSSETPPRGSESRVSITAAAGSGPRGGSSGVFGERGDGATAEVTVTSSSGGSGATSSGQQTENPPPPAVAAARRRRARGPVEEEEFHVEDVEFESADAKTEVRGSTSAKRSRAAEVHNLSERRRRDRINEKMKALQELIPHCNKSDKASMLDEAIEYLKSLQMQVQMMSMGCSMFPMVFPNVQHYMSPMGMGMNLPVIPFPSVFTGSTLALPAAATHSGPKLPIRGFHMQPIPAPDPSTVQAINQTGPMLNPVGAQNPTQHQTPNFVDPYQHFVGLHQVQLPESKNKPVARSSTSEPNAGSGAENLDKPKIG